MDHSAAPILLSPLGFLFSSQFTVAFSAWGRATPHLSVISHCCNTHVEKAQGFILAHGSGGLVQGQLAPVLWAWGLRLSTRGQNIE